MTDMDEARPDDERDAREVLGRPLLWLIDRVVDVANWFRR